MDRRTLLWTITAFFGASIVFQAIQAATEGQSTATTVALELVALVLIVAFVTFLVRRRDGGGGGGP